MAQTLTQDQVIAAATAFIKRGWFVFPLHGISIDAYGAHCSCGLKNCSNAGKHPLKTGWQKNCTNDVAKLSEMFAPHNNVTPNIGIATGKKSGITVIDIDVKHDGVEHWKDICDKFNIPETFWVRTGSGGYHLYFKYNAAFPTGTSVLADGIDIRNDGALVVAPPSLHASGGQYYCDNLDAPLAEIPDELYSLIASKATAFDEKPQSSISLAKAEALLEYIDNTSYQKWFSVGVILARNFARSDEGFNLYQKWSENGYDSSNPREQQRKMTSIYYNESTKTASSGESLSVGTLIQWAKNAGYTTNKNKGNINYFCYVAQDNSYIFLANCSKWPAGGVDGAVPPLIVDGESVKASQWLRENRLVYSMTVDGFLPTGIINGYASQSDGNIIKNDEWNVLNLFCVQAEISPSPFNVDIKTACPYINKEEESPAEEEEGGNVFEMPDWMKEGLL